MLLTPPCFTLCLCLSNSGTSGRVRWSRSTIATWEPSTPSRLLMKTADLSVRQTTRVFECGSGEYARVQFSVPHSGALFYYFVFCLTCVRRNTWNRKKIGRKKTFITQCHLVTLAEAPRIKKPTNDFILEEAYPAVLLILSESQPLPRLACFTCMCYTGRAGSLMCTDNAPASTL